MALSRLLWLVFVCAAYGQENPNPPKGRVRVAEQIFIVPEETIFIARKNPLGAVYGFPLCYGSLYAQPGFFVTVDLAFPYNYPGDLGVDFRYVLFTNANDTLGTSWILDNGENNGQTFVSETVFSTSVTAPMPTSQTGVNAPTALYLYILEDINYFEMVPYYVTLSIYWDADQWPEYTTFPVYDVMPPTSMNPPSEALFFPLMKFADGSPYYNPINWNIRQLVSVQSAWAPRFLYPQGNPEFQGSSTNSSYKVALPVCPPFGQTNFSVRVIAEALDSLSPIDLYVCTPDQIGSGAPTSVHGYGCNPSTAGFADANGALVAQVAINEATMLFASVLSRAQYQPTGSGSNFFITASAYPGFNLTQTNWNFNYTWNWVSYFSETYASVWEEIGNSYDPSFS